MTKGKKLLLSVLGTGFLVMQCFGPGRTNPPVARSHTIQNQLQVPPRVANIMDRACMDCHSYETRWPWYSRIAPVSWWIVHHVNAGRRQLNLSEWTQYKPSSAVATLGAMATAVKGRAMPLDSYGDFHPEARLSGDDIKVFCDWASSERQREMEKSIPGRTN
jgi:Haem-binding domain